MIQVKFRNSKILFIIKICFFKTWALAFRQDPDLKNVEHFYQECKQQGLQFPPAESENFVKTAVPATVR